MILSELKNHFQSIPDEEVVTGVGLPFSWRGSYDEVAFPIVENITAKECKANINVAYNDTFYGYKGGEYKYDDFTTVNFEEKPSHYSGVGYLARWVFKMDRNEDG